MEGPFVETKLGKYRGRYVETHGGRNIAAFNGIRYAKPPINELRLKEAEKIEKHEGIYEAIKDGNDSVQPNNNYNMYPSKETQGLMFVGSEDCLFLNVYTPLVKPEKPYPVIVFIHGGGNYYGTCSYNWHGPQLLLDKDIVLVTVTYRLGVFGFLVLDDNELPSNLGLKDQSLALHWVKDHISCFGGDPESITLSGNSAGGANTQFHMLSPRSKGTFKRAISESGSIQCPWAMLSRKKAIKTTLKLAALLNCPTTPAELATSLREKTVHDIMTAVQQIKESNPLKLWDTLFGPVFEKRSEGFITVEDLIEGSTIPWMAGLCRDEGFLFYRDNYRMGDADLSQENKSYREFFPLVFGYLGHSQQDEITEKIKQFYFGQDNISDKNLTQYVNMLTDGVFAHDVLENVRSHKGTSYLYVLTHLGQRSLTYELPQKGVCHADELFYLFPFSKTPIKLIFNEPDSKVQKLFVELWSNFATYGHPTPDKGETQWPESNKGENFVSITSDGIEQGKNIFSERMNFWDKLSTQKFNLITKES